MNRQRGPRRSPWQRAAVDELRKVSAALPDDFAVSGRPTLHWSGCLLVPIRLRTSSLVHHPGGLRLDDHENFVLWIGETDFSPPLVEVRHDRFVGFPHVLHGRQLCIYLDVAREWNPQLGVSSAVDRLHDWLKDATANRFDPNTSLFHAVGGVPYGSSRLPTVVVRDDCPMVRAQSGYLVKRTDHRLDLHFARTQSEQVQIPVVSLTMPLPLRIGHTFTEVLARLDDPFADSWLGTYPKHAPQSPVFLTALAASASRMPEGSPQMFALTVPHPAGGPPHLLVGMIPGDAADRLRHHVRNRRTPPISVNTRTFDLETPVEWCPVSDERGSVTTRRDSASPVSAFHGKTVHVWGCGGLGSWIAEFITRAGARRLVLCDPGTITGGLLVRQNFTELDLGNGKAEALRERILAIRDDIEVVAHSGIIPEDLLATFSAAHVVIDATVSLRIGQLLDQMASPAVRPLIAEVATDVKTGTLGILSVSAPGTSLGANEIDRRVGTAVKVDGGLEPFHTFWTEVRDVDELVPTRGCSVPTFHGSAADMAAVAASLTSLLGSHVSATVPVSGTHLIALPHSPVGPFHRFIQPD